MPYFQNERATIREQAWIALPTPPPTTARVFDIVFSAANFASILIDFKPFSI
jgi:hypothetical protein